MKVKLKFSLSEYKGFATILATIIQCQNDFTVRCAIERINYIEGCQNLLQKIANNLLLPPKKKYSVTLNNFEIQCVVLGYEDASCWVENCLPPYEDAIMTYIVEVCYNEANRILRHRENLKGNLQMQLK